MIKYMVISIIIWVVGYALILPYNSILFLVNEE